MPQRIHDSPNCSARNSKSASFARAAAIRLRACSSLSSVLLRTAMWSSCERYSAADTLKDDAPLDSTDKDVEADKDDGSTPTPRLLFDVLGGDGVLNDTNCRL
jgi:hypothetical protein